MELPKFVVINSLANKNYLCPSGPNSLMRFEAAEVDSRGVKHEVVKAKSGPGMIHIRCCETGKYWTLGLTTGLPTYVAAQADQPREDSRGPCTLIMPSHNIKDGVNVVNLQCRSLGDWYSIYRNTDGYINANGNGIEDFIITDWESLPPKLPQGPSDGDQNTNIGGRVSIGNTTIGRDVSIGYTDTGGTVSIGSTSIRGGVTVGNTNTGGNVSIGNLDIGAGTLVGRGSSIGNTNIKGGVSVWSSAPNVKDEDQARK